MFEALLTKVLNKVLGDFIENIDERQLDIKLLAGNVNLLNLRLRPDIFEALPLPFDLAYGRVGSIKIQIPMVWNLLNSPITIEIADVLAVVKPRHIRDWNEDHEVSASKRNN